MDQNIESEILEKRKLCKVLKVFKIVSFIGIFAPFVAFMVVSRNGYELDSDWLLIPALFVGGFFLFSYMETNKLKDQGTHGTVCCTERPWRALACD